MTTNDLFLWMASRRVPPRGCARCGLVQVSYFRDWQERPIGFCCIARGRYEATKVLAARFPEMYTDHDCEADGCG